MVGVIKPIPKALLIDRAVYQVVKGKDGWGKEDVEETTLSDVLVQPNHSLKRGQTNESESYKLLLFFDAINSSPFGHVFAVDDQVVYEGKVYRIADVVTAKALSGEAHHYEVELV